MFTYAEFLQTLDVLIAFVTLILWIRSNKK